MPSTILLSALPHPPTEDLHRTLLATGFAVSGHALGSPPAVDFGPVLAVVIDVGGRVDLAAAQTRRWRVELGDDHVPILWVLPNGSAELVVAGLDVGADLCVARPVDAEVFIPQVRAMCRARSMAARLGEKVAETRMIADQLQKAYAQLDQETEMARRVHRRSLPGSTPEVGAARVAVCYRPRSRVGGDFYEVRQLDENHLGFFLGDVIGRRTATGSMLALFVKQAANMKEIAGARYRLVPPNEVLVGVNRELMGLGLDDPPLIAMLVGLLNVRNGAVSIARAGLPAPVYIPANGQAETWSVPGQFLGTVETAYHLMHGTLLPGDKLLIGSDGTHPDGDPTSGVDPDPLVEAATRHRGQSGQAFVDAVASDILPHVQHPDDFTLLGIEMIAQPGL